MSGLHMRGIPAPTDSYDHENSTRANVTSLYALFASYDASMDSLHESIHEHMQRIGDISDRAESVRRSWKDLQRKDAEADGTGSAVPVPVLRVACPSSYDDAIGISRRRRTSQRSSLDTTALSKAKDASNIAIGSVLQRAASDLERLTATGLATMAKPSDIWLDRASAFGEGWACRKALEMNAVPPLLVENSVQSITSRADVSVMAEEARYYKDGASAMRAKDGQDGEGPHDKERGGGGKDGASVVSENTRGTRYTNYSIMSHGTASHRRQQRKLAAAQRRSEETGGSAATTAPTRIGNKSQQHPHGNVSSSSSRHQLMSGSLPYVCEMLHDTHRLGKGGHIFPPVKDVCDLMIYGSNEMAYEPYYGDSSISTSSSSSTHGGHDDAHVQHLGSNIGRSHGVDAEAKQGNHWRKLRDVGNVGGGSRRSKTIGGSGGGAELFKVVEDAPVSTEEINSLGSEEESD